MNVTTIVDFMKVTHYCVKDVSKYIWFHNTKHHNKPKTEVWDVVSKSGNDILGQIKYFANWRQYIFEPMGKPYFSTGCMIDIINFIKELQVKKHLTPESNLNDSKGGN